MTVVCKTQLLAAAIACLRLLAGLSIESLQAMLHVDSVAHVTACVTCILHNIAEAWARI